MKRRTQKLIAADLFCGGGGFTTGAERAGIHVALAINHWRTAILTHQRNHPNTRHICARIDDVDPRHDRTLPDCDVLLASPECTHFSIARGGQPVDDQRRATPWHVCLWAECKRPRWIVVENVREFRDWGPLKNQGTVKKPLWRPDAVHKGETYRAWVQALESLGYRVDSQLLNAADYGAPTKRVRLFIMAVRNDVRLSTIPWPEPTHAGRWLPAASIIDWSIPCPSIFSRKRPLAEKTLRRIEAGLKKFVGPFVTQFHNGLDGERRNYSPDSPLPTLDTQNRYGLAVPYLLPRQGYFDCHRDKPAKSVNEPLGTVTANHAPAHVVVPFMADVNHGGNDNRTADLAVPMATITAKHGKSLIVPYLIDAHHGSGDARGASLGGPMPTIVSKPGNSLVVPYLVKYYGTGGVLPVSAPIDTVTARDRFGLAMASLVETMGQLGVVDIGFRMLDVHELAAAQGFPAGYYLHGTKAEQVRQVGNAVCPPVAEAICRTIGAAA